MYIESYKKLIVWQRAIELSKSIYKDTENLPKAEIYGLVSQMRRCSISIPSNIAEGYNRGGLGEYLNFLNIAAGSAAELETQLILVKELFPALDFSQSEPLLLEIQKMLTVMIKKIRDKKNLNPKRLTLEPRTGFTLVEMIVAMGLFLIVIGITTGAFVHILRTQHETVAILAAEGNGSSAIEQMAREVRTGQGFSVVNGELHFTNAQNDSVVYRVNSATSVIERSADGGTIFEPITADNVLVNNLQFILFTGSAGNPYPPRITIVLQAGATGLPFTDSVVNLQTTVSARTLP